MPRKNVILNLPGFTVQKISGYDPIVFEVSHRNKVKCPHCDGKSLRKKDTFIRKVRHEMIGLRLSLLKIKMPKFHCRSCYFNQRLPGILKHQRATERLKEQLSQQHSHGISQKTLSKTFKLGKATIERWYQYYYWRLNQMIYQPECPRVLGIDEHRFGNGFATTLCNLHRHKIFDITKGRSEPDLRRYLASLNGREKVQVICIDLSSTYRSIIKKYFPNAKIVADRFHVIRQLNQQCLQVYQQLDPGLKYHRGLLGALRARPDKLNSKKKALRDEYLKIHPAIAAVYSFKQELHHLLMIKHRTAEQCRLLIPQYLRMVEELKKSPFKSLQTLGKTLYNWREEIVRMWRFTKNNGITEGFHRKMKLIQRRAYGFRNFTHTRPVCSPCGSRFVRSNFSIRKNW